MSSKIGQIGVDHLVSRIVSVGAANIETISVAEWLNDADVVPAVIVLRLPLAHTLGRVAGLEGETIVVTTCAGYVGQIHCDDNILELLIILRFL